MANKPFNPWQQNPFADLHNQQSQLDYLQENMRKNAERINYQHEQLQNMANAMSTSQRFATLITMKRNSLGLSHDDIAAKTGLTSFDIMSFESGSNNESTEKLFKILSALGIQINAF